ncbi:MAG: ATP-dependent DNA helicase RuvA [Gemmataceae bacterium]|nr:ATP-dependent DNA helicase RuvA [Gemmataceae bacterium]
MITKLTGTVNRVFDEEARVQVGPLEYQVMVPEFVRRRLQGQLNTEITLFTTQYFEGNMNTGKMIPRLVGFLAEAELEFFELFCTVEKIGVKKALKALTRPVKEIADAISRQDAKWLTTLPGIGPASADQVIATLRRKVTRYALIPGMSEDGATPVAAPDVLEDAYQSLMRLGLNPLEARQKLDPVLQSGKKFASVEDVLLAVYAKG